MKYKNKSNYLPWLAETIMIWTAFVLATVINSGSAQSNNPYYHYHHHPTHSNVWGDSYKQYSYQFMPSLPSSGGANLIGGGRVVEAVKAHPLHYSSFLSGSSYHSAPPPFLSTAASQPSSSYYSGYYYGGDKHIHHPKSRPTPYSVSSSMYVPPRPHYQASSPTTVTTITSSSPPTPFSPFGQPPPPPLPSYSRFPPGPIASPSMDTYREALDLFSEVVRKLEKETVPGFGTYPPPNYLQSNGVYSSASPSSGLPDHIDHIMGPDFLQRAHKLYNKIIKEQSYNRGPPPGYYSSASRGHPLNGLSYLENTIQPGGRGRTRTTTYSYSRSSPNSRNMIVDKVTPDSVEKSLVDTVKALEVNMGRTMNQPEYNHEEGEEEGPPSTDIMEASESRMVPQQHYPPPPINTYDFPDHRIDSPSSSVPPPQQQSEPAQPPSTSNPPIAPAQSQAVSVNDNDFIEHPLAYNEYEELIKEIAMNHNY